MNQTVWKALILLPTVLCLEFSSVWVYLSVQFSHSVMSNSFWPHGLQHARPPCPSPTPGVYQNSSTLSRWCHPTISSSVVPYSSCLESFPASGSFPMSQLFSRGGRRSFTFNIGPSIEHPGLISFRMNWLDLLAVQGTLKGLSRWYGSIVLNVFISEFKIQLLTVFGNI